MRSVDLFCSGLATHPGVLTHQRKHHMTLRPLDSGDAEPIYHIVSNWQVARMLEQLPWPYQKAHSQAFVDHVSGSSAKTDARYFAIEDSCFNFLGMIGLVELSRTPSVGFFLDRRYWGAGIMSEVLAAVCEAAFRELPADRILSGVFADNTGSLRVHEKCGFHKSGETRTLCSPRRKHLTRIDLVLNRPAYDGHRYQS